MNSCHRSQIAAIKLQNGIVQLTGDTALNVLTFELITAWQINKLLLDDILCDASAAVH